MLISFLLTVVFFIILIIYLINKSKTPTLKNIYTLLTNIITLLESFFLTKLLVKLTSKNIIITLSNKIKEILKITESEWIDLSIIDKVSSFLIITIISIILFILVFLIIYIINHILKRIIFKLLQKESYSTYENKSNIIINLLLSITSFTIISFAIFYPFGSISKILSNGINKVNYEVPKIIKTFNNNPVIKLHANNISLNFFNNITKTEEIKTSNEIEGLISIILVTKDINDGNNTKKNYEVIKSELEDTYLMASFLTEISRSAAYNFKQNKPFMGIELELPSDNRKEIYITSLEVISTWKKENLINDIKTVFEVYEILYNYNLIKEHTSEDLLNTLQNEDFTKELFLSLFKNDDFKKILPSIMNFGLNEILDNLHLESSNTYINTVDLNSLTEEEIIKEAKVFSLLITETNNIKENKFNIEDLDKLKEIRNSKLLNDLLYNLLLRLFQDKLIGE